jgi:selenide,water dikinase
MQTPNNIPALRDIVLVGGGHSHVQVLKAFAMRPEPGVRLTMICRDLQTPYSGMLPGCISGVYGADDIHIKLAPLCRFANARLIHDEVSGLDLDAQRVRFAARPDLRYDIVSLNTGAVPKPPHPEAVTVKPISRFLPKWREIKARIQAGQRLVVVGGGAGGVELALAVRRALPQVELQLVSETLLPGHNPGVMRKAAAALAKFDIRWVQNRAVQEVPTGLRLADDEVIAADYVLWVTDVAAPVWLAESGLSTDSRGFVSVDRYLRSISHPQVFAAGDVSHLVGQERAKSGVYAVRAGPFLTENLRRAVRGEPLRTYRAQAQHLALIGDGHGAAIASRGSWSAQGRHWWWIKDRIDQNFMRKFNDLPAMDEPEVELPASLAESLPDQLMRCGGCGAKLAADPLRRVLSRLPEQAAAQVELGIGDDAALLKTNGSTLLTIDGFRAMLDDPYLFGRIAAHHALNDIYAMAAQPSAALAFVTVPLMAEALMEEELFQLLRGVTDVLNAHDVPLVGGHSAEGLELGVGLTVTGSAGAVTLQKQGAQVGDQLLLTKPIGTGVVLAAAMQGEAQTDSLAAVQQSMDTSNAPAVGIFVEAGAHALTDITGFGLAGHLGEILRASAVGVRLTLADIPLFPGVTDLMRRLQSSLQQANELALQDYELRGAIMPDEPRLRALADPQTSGGLLGSVPAEQSDACLAALRDAGYPAAVIGEVLPSGSWVIE